MSLAVTAAHREQFRTEGYFVVEGALDADRSTSRGRAAIGVGLRSSGTCASRA